MGLGLGFLALGAAAAALPPAEPATVMTSMFCSLLPTSSASSHSSGLGGKPQLSLRPSAGCPEASAAAEKSSARLASDEICSVCVPPDARSRNESMVMTDKFHSAYKGIWQLGGGFVVFGFLPLYNILISRPSCSPSVLAWDPQAKGDE